MYVGTCICRLRLTPPLDEGQGVGGARGGSGVLRFDFDPFELSRGRALIGRAVRDCIALDDLGVS